LKLVVPDPASVTPITCVKKNLWVQYLKHTIDLEAAHSIGSQERSDGIAVRPRCRFFFVWEDGTNVDPKHSPQCLIRRTPNLAAPCSDSNIFLLLRHHAAWPPPLRSFAQRCIVKTAYIYPHVNTLTCFISLCQPDTPSTGQIKGQQMHCSVRLGTRNLQVNATWTACQRLDVVRA
jgi:hypothetical protein